MKKKNLLDYTNLLSPNDYKGMRKQYIITLRPHMTKENISLNKPFINKKLSVRRNEISHVNEKKNKKVCRTLNYFKHFYIFISAVSVCVSLSAFCFISWYSCRRYTFCSKNKDLGNNCRN